MSDVPFPETPFLARLQRWVECESPTWNAAAVDGMLDLAARDLAVAGASIERIAGRMGFGGAVRARFPHPHAGEPGIIEPCPKSHRVIAVIGEPGFDGVVADLFQPFEDLFLRWKAAGGIKLKGQLELSCHRRLTLL